MSSIRLGKIELIDEQSTNQSNPQNKNHHLYTPQQRHYHPPTSNQTLPKVCTQPTDNHPSPGVTLHSNVSPR